MNTQTDSRSRAGEAHHVLAPTLEFLRQHAPFDRMTGPHLEFLAKHLRLGFYSTGTLIAEPATGPARTFYIIKQGRVRGEASDGARPTNGELWELTPGECFPVGALMARRPSAIRQRAVEDTFCFELDRADFEKLLSQSPVFHDFCSRRIAHLLDEALRGARAHLTTKASNDSSLNTSLENLVRRAPVACQAHTPLSQVLAAMHAERVGSIVAIDEHGKPQGIFTLHDLLGRVATRNLPLETPLEHAMTPNPITISASASAYEAAQTMARHHVGHLCVIDDNRLIGVVSERDLFSLQRIGLVHLSRSIMRSPDITTLAKYRRDVHRLVDQMLIQGASVVQLTQIVALLNDHVARRAIALTVAEAGGNPPPFTWLLFGSEGRQEQTLKTDQDNGMLFQVPPGRRAEDVRAELLPLARRINEALATCGFPLCPGNIMASNPQCCLSLEEWQARFDTWIEQGTPQHLLNASIFFDFRMLEGDAQLVETLRQWVLERAATVPRFLHLLAGNALQNQPPLGLLRDFVVETEGEHAHMINLKLHGATPFVDGARLFALAGRIGEVNTLERLRAAARRGVARGSEVDAWCDAYAFIQMLRMRGQRAQEQANQAPDNYVDPERLNDLDRRVLKESFRQARKLQSKISLDYGL